MLRYLTCEPALNVNWMLTLNFTLPHTGHANYTEKTLFVTPSNDPPKIHILSPDLSIVQGSIMSLSEWNGSCSIVDSVVWDGPPRPLRGFISMRVSILLSYRTLPYPQTVNSLCAEAIKYFWK